MTRKRRRFTAELKKRVALEAPRGERAVQPGSSPVPIRLPVKPGGTRKAVGETIGIRVDPVHACLFDAASGDWGWSSRGAGRPAPLLDQLHRQAPDRNSGERA